MLGVRAGKTLRRVGWDGNRHGGVREISGGILVAGQSRDYTNPKDETVTTGQLRYFKTLRLSLCNHLGALLNV